MKYTIMKCPICGKEFYSEYWTGGYIDHVTNFSENLLGYKQTTMENTEENINKWADEIYYTGNEVRQKEDIECRLNCFLQADFIPEEIRKAVENEVRPDIGKREAVVDKFTEMVNNFIIGLEDEELHFFEKYLNESNHGTYYTAQSDLENLVEKETTKRIKKSYKYQEGDKVRLKIDNELLGKVAEIKTIDFDVYPTKIWVEIIDTKQWLSLSERRIEKIEG